MAIHFVNNWDIGWGSLLTTALTLVLIMGAFWVFVRVIKNKHQEVLLAKVLKFHVEFSETPTDKKIIDLITENDKLKIELKSNKIFNGFWVILLIMILWIQSNQKTLINKKV